MAIRNSEITPSNEPLSMEDLLLKKKGDVYAHESIPAGIRAIAEADAALNVLLRLGRASGEVAMHWLHGGGERKRLLPRCAPWMSPNPMNYIGFGDHRSLASRRDELSYVRSGRR